MSKLIFSFCLVSVVAILAGCGQSSDVVTTTAQAPVANASQFLLSSEPAGAQGVIDFRKQAQNDDEVVLVGRIGGDSNPWVKGRAAFLIVDESLKPCNEIGSDNCPVPWDYCCELDMLPKAKVMVKLINEQGQAVAEDARQFLQVKELDTVVVRGRAKRDDAGNVTVLASGLYVRR